MEHNILQIIACFYIISFVSQTKADVSTITSYLEVTRTDSYSSAEHVVSEVTEADSYSSSEHVISEAVHTSATQTSNTPGHSATTVIGTQITSQPASPTLITSQPTSSIQITSQPTSPKQITRQSNSPSSSTTPETERDITAVITTPVGAFLDPDLKSQHRMYIYIDVGAAILFIAFFIVIIVVMYKRRIMYSSSTPTEELDAQFTNEAYVNKSDREIPEVIIPGPDWLAYKNLETTVQRHSNISSSTESISTQTDTRNNNVEDAVIERSFANPCFSGSNDHLIEEGGFELIEVEDVPWLDNRVLLEDDWKHDLEISDDFSKGDLSVPSTMDS